MTEIFCSYVDQRLHKWKINRILKVKFAAFYVYFYFQYIYIYIHCTFNAEVR